MEPLSNNRLNELAELLVDPATDDWAAEDRWEELLGSACEFDARRVEEVCTFVRQCKQANIGIRLEVEIDELAETLQPGTQIDHFTLVKKIKSGGMGTVYEALSQGPDLEPKPVAIKVIKDEINAEKLIRRLRTERYIMSRLDHPNIVKIHFAGSTPGGDPYFAMDLVDGALPIHRYCDVGGLTLADRIQVFRKLCSVVTFVHENNVVHRDLTPGNILMTKDGQPKLVDFGLATQIEPVKDAPTFVNSEFTPRQLGTPGRMSPQQEQGQPGSPADDIFALGTILRDLLGDPAAFNTGLAFQIRDIVDCCLQYQPKDRFQTVSELSAALEAAGTTPIPDPGLRNRFAIFASSRWIIAIVMLLGLILAFFSYSKIATSRQSQAILGQINDEEKVAESFVKQWESAWTPGLEALTGAKGSFQDQERRALTLIGNNSEKAKKTLGFVYLGCGNMFQPFKNKLPEDRAPQEDGGLLDEYLKSYAARLPPGDQKKMAEDFKLLSRRVLLRVVTRLAAYCSQEKVAQGLGWLREFASLHPKTPVPAFLAELFMKGDSVVSRDPVEAYKWAQISAQAGDPDGINILGDVYFEGRAVPKNEELAIDQWEKSAYLGSRLGQMNFARALALGKSARRGTKLVEAYMWAILAAASHSGRFIDFIHKPPSLRKDGSLEKDDAVTLIEAVDLRDRLGKELPAATARKAEESARVLSATIAAKKSSASTASGR